MAGRLPVVVLHERKIYFGRAAGDDFLTECAAADGFVDRGGRITDISAFVGVVNGFLPKKKFKKTRVNLIVKTPECLLRFAKPPAVARGDLDGLIRNNLNEYFPNPGGYTVSYRLVGDGENPAVFFAALPEGFAAPYIEAFTRCGIVIDKLDIFQNAAASAHGSWDASSMFITVYEDRVCALYIENGMPRAARDIRRAYGADAGRALRDELQMFARLYGMGRGAALYVAEPDSGEAAALFPEMELKTINMTEILSKYV